MKKIKLPVTSANLATRIASIRETAKKKLTKFMIDKVVENKLGIRTFNFEFDFKGDRDGGQRKSVQKFRDIILKSVEKQIPYIQYTEDGLFLKNDSRDSVSLNLILRPELVEISRTRSVRPERFKQVKLIKRYIRLLNRKFIKGKFCVRIEAEETFKILPEHRDAFDAAGKKQQSTSVYVTPTLFVRIKLCTWHHEAYGNRRVREEYPTLEQYIESYKRDYPNSDIYAPQSWTTITLVPTSQRRVIGLENFSIPERFFLHIKDIEKVVKTFARVTSYDSTAFNIGAAETT